MVWCDGDIVGWRWGGVFEFDFDFGGIEVDVDLLCWIEVVYVDDLFI